MDTSSGQLNGNENNNNNNNHNHQSSDNLNTLESQESPEVTLDDQEFESLSDTSESVASEALNTPRTEHGLDSEFAHAAKHFPDAEKSTPSQRDLSANSIIQKHNLS